jgi:hypothetical protein
VQVKVGEDYLVQSGIGDCTPVEEDHVNKVDHDRVEETNPLDEILIGRGDQVGPGSDHADTGGHRIDADTTL